MHGTQYAELAIVTSEILTFRAFISVSTCGRGSKVVTGLSSKESSSSAPMNATAFAIYPASSGDCKIPYVLAGQPHHTLPFVCTERTFVVNALVRIGEQHGIGTQMQIDIRPHVQRVIGKESLPCGEHHDAAAGSLLQASIAC